MLILENIIKAYCETSICISHPDVWNVMLDFACKSVYTVLLFCRDEKIAIMREKHSALMRPVVFTLDHVCSITAAPAETPHEAWFQQTYGNTIISALERLRNPTNPANPASSWLPFRQVSVCCKASIYIHLIHHGFWFSKRSNYMAILLYAELCLKIYIQF